MTTTVRVLILVDGDGSFSPSHHRFGLSELIATLQADIGDGLSFSVTRAHRYGTNINLEGSVDVTQDADILGFRFDNSAHFTLQKFDEIWLFGFASANSPYNDPTGYELQSNELDLLSQFMDSGGGVFATGDHDDLGKDLCAMVPRVGTMRRWHTDWSALHWPGTGPDYSLYDEDAGYSPPVKGVFRHSTIVKGANGLYEFDNQSDDIPQTIQPVITVVGSRRSLITQVVSYPHPLLCGTHGVINVLPDHMHEGQCQIPTDLTATFHAGGTNRAEYPNFYGRPLSPQIVAYGNVIGRKRDESYNDPGAGNNSGYDDNEDLISDTFCDIAAWDGQVVNCGRVVVDSTFHHFVNDNVIGVGQDALHNWSADEPIKLQGFNGSPAGKAAYAQIRQYWRNIARWIAPAPLQSQFSLQWLQRAASAAHLKEISVGVRNLHDVIHFGTAIKTYIQTWLPPCATLEISSQGVPNPLSILLRQWFILINLPNPPPEIVDIRELPININTLSNLALGATALELMQLRRTREEHSVEATLKAIQGATEKAIHGLLHAYTNDITRSAHALGELAEQLGKSRG